MPSAVWFPAVIPETLATGSEPVTPPLPDAERLIAGMSPPVSDRKVGVVAEPDAGPEKTVFAL